MLIQDQNRLEILSSLGLLDGVDDKRYILKRLA